MKTREKSLWRWLSRARVDGSIHVERVENTLSKSTPDVEASTGKGGFWIELKTAAAPARMETPVRFRFQKGQAFWLRDRWEIDRAAWLLVQVDDRRYLLAGEYAPRVQDGVPEYLLSQLSETAPDAGPGEILRAASHLMGRT